MTTKAMTVKQIARVENINLAILKIAKDLYTRTYGETDAEDLLIWHTDGNWSVGTGFHSNVAVVKHFRKQLSAIEKHLQRLEKLLK